jgi:hypothetical protein
VKNEIQVKFEQDNEKMQKEKDQLLAEENMVKEAVTKALLSVLGLAQEREDSIEIQLGKLVEAIQQLQECIMELELQEMSSTLTDVCDQRKEATRNTVERIRALASECKKLSNCSAQTYEFLLEYLELGKMEEHLQEAQKQESTMQA